MLIFNLIAQQADRARELTLPVRRRRARAGARRVPRAPAGDARRRRRPTTRRRSAPATSTSCSSSTRRSPRTWRPGKPARCASSTTARATARARRSTRPRRCCAPTTGSGARSACCCAASRPRSRNPLNVEDVDLATPQQSGALVLFLVAFYGLFASVMGGMAVALDTTAGERERQSLEPLLMTPARAARARRPASGSPSVAVQRAGRAVTLAGFYLTLALRAAAGRSACRSCSARASSAASSSCCCR